MAMLRVPVTPADHRLGDADAPVVMVEYGDYQCPHCARAQPVIGDLMRHFGDDLALVFRHFPLSEAHPFSQAAAEAAEFAGQRGVFWEMHDALFANQSKLSYPTIFALAGELNLPQLELQQALAEGAYIGKVQNDFMGGVRSGVNGTPCFFVNGARHDAPHSFWELAASINSALLTAPPPHRTPESHPSAGISSPSSKGVRP